MQRYNFDKLTVRRGTNCAKWDEDEYDDIIPLWVADMDFETAPAIVEALHERVAHGVFGYTHVPVSYYESIVRWYRRRHNFVVKAGWIVYTTGVVPAVSAVIKALTMPSEEVVVMTPAYNCFFPCISNNGCKAVTVPLLQTADSYVIDYDALEQACSSQRARALLLCNPHNPVGRVWTRDELERVNEICMRHNVKVIADEIHNEIVMPGHCYTPFASISDDCLHNSVTCVSPTKGFNIAGLQIANIICADPDLRYRIDRAINLNECCDVNPFGVIALQAAYNDSEDWLDMMCEYVHRNYVLLCDTLAAHAPHITVSKLEGTYLAWLDIRRTGMTSDAIADRLLSEAHVRVCSGAIYGADGGEGFIRLNLACPRSRLEDALTRMLPTLIKNKN